MYSDWGVIFWALDVVIFLWLAILSFFVIRERVFLKRLFPRGSRGDIRDRLDEIFEENDSFRLEIKKVSLILESLKNDGLNHIQKVGFVRFNPYGDTGGDQSFAIALLDSRGSGFILTSLHARSGTRIFAKKVDQGKAEHKLSKEEEEVLEKALK